MDQLPEEVVLMIFEWVPSRELLGAVSQVCRRWAALATHWAVEVRRVGALRLRPTVRAMRVRACPTPAMLDDLLLRAYYLQDITMSATAPLTAEQYESLVLLPHLQHLDVFHYEQALTVRVVSTLLRIRSLVVNEAIGSGVLRALAGSKRLQALHMYGRAQYFSRRELVLLLEARGAHLRELTLRCTELPDAAYASLAHCRALESLQLYSCWMLQRDGALHVARLPRLRRLHLTGAHMLVSSSLADFLISLPLKLEELALSRCGFGDEHVSALLGLPALRVLEVWHTSISAQGVLTLAKNVLSLRVLDLNILLTNQQIEEIDNHSNIISLRCVTEHTICNFYRSSKKKKAEKVVTKRLTMKTTDAWYANKYFRNSGEGFSGSLFYHWTQNMDLHLL